MKLSQYQTHNSYSKFYVIFLLILLIFILGAVFCIYSVSKVSAASLTVTATINVTVCGDGIAGGNEDCDGDDLNEETCQSIGYDQGTLSCNADCTFDISDCVTGQLGGGGGGTGFRSIKAEVIIEGKSSPYSEITFLSDGKVIAVKKADSSGNFRFENKMTSSGLYTFSLWAKDQKARKSAIFSFTVNIKRNTITTINDILLPPTIEIEETIVEGKEILNIFGRTAPNSEVTIFIESPERSIERKTNSLENGTWFYALEKINIIEDSYNIKAMAESPEGFISPFSKIKRFSKGEVLVDRDEDMMFGLVDFSILLYWWNRYNEDVDLNKNGIVDLPDLSIMMYYWTG